MATKYFGNYFVKARNISEDCSAMLEARKTSAAIDRRNKRHFFEYADKEHDFELYFGDNPTGLKLTMTGKKAMESNRKYEDDFYNGKTKRLKKWYTKYQIKELFNK